MGQRGFAGASSPAMRYARGLALLALTLALIELFGDALRANILLILTAPVILTAWLAGTGPSAMVSVLGLITADVLFIDPIGRVGGDPPGEAVGLGVFLLISALVGSVTEQLRRSRAEAEQSRDDVARALKSRERLVRGFSHDLRNPLGAAQGQVSLLLEGVRGELTAEQRETVERIRGALTTAIDLIGDVVELARAGAGRVPIEARPIDPRAVVLATADVFRAQANAAGLELRVDVPDALPTIETDIARVRQILGNMVSNAVKYTPEGGRLTLRAAVRDDGPAPGGWVAIDAVDTGPGIPPDKLPLLFEEFTRVADDGTGGAGLGLAISRHLARSLGGEITAESEVGVGSTFTLWLPLKPPPRAPRSGGAPATRG